MENYTRPHTLCLPVDSPARFPSKKSFQLIRLKSRATGPQQSTYEKLNILQSLIVVKMIIYSMINNYWFYWVFVCLCFTSCCIQITNYYSFLSSFLWFFSIQNLFTADDWLEFDSAKSTISRSQLISIIVGVFFYAKYQQVNERELNLFINWTHNEVFSFIFTTFFFDNFLSWMTFVVF